MPDAAFARALARWAVAEPAAADLAGEVALPVGIASGALPDGGRAWFVFNWGWEPQALTLATAVADAVSGEHLAAGTEVSLPAWSTRTFIGR
ncbi:hypothetical protein GB864_17660 [Agromyces sp. MMS17-SY077]|uniref:Beta-galactosidase C-terminal domain-containing protein n=1 Tax=Agromyces seonyuensis TaxID=2662446 RepID=A0A6I4P186_9MICO|nr:hypothetical protein [Agromyces seonyuensis]